MLKQVQIPVSIQRQTPTVSQGSSLDPRKQPETRQLPAWAESRAAWLGIVRDGKTEKYYLPSGMAPLTDNQRGELETRVAVLKQAVTCVGIDEEKAKLVLITKMLLAMAGGPTTEAAAEARGEAYLCALEGLPAWAVDEAIRRWHRADIGQLDGISPTSIDYRWASPPGILRAIALKVLRDYEEQIAKASKLLTASATVRDCIGTVCS